ncbi:M20/M25/M40 family metallo-hydrolase [Gimibacter soli]|uniref:M20/M25/M40 family metallo-hydrolase n=1 Tax=Gimibacter soli TaxID=3024400 RepID=A0AAF0BL39_9PROT|nr:M20/M25/M40 family metallo-hydrolase [Gimibacter soli]WCL53687.1 M20/M25/M40 family metallo-hydrolase [Gimibacter soli]
MKRILISALLMAATSPLALAADRNANEQAAVDLYKEVVGFRSVEGRGGMRPLAKMLADRFVKGGFPAGSVHYLEMPNDTAALVVRYEGSDATQKPVVLMAHMDVVEALPEDWQRDPYTLIEEDGYFYGRGTMDNKEGVTVLTHNFLRLKAEGYTPDRTLIIAFSGDEETHMATTEALYTKHLDLTNAEFALNTDGGGGTMDAAGNPLGAGVQTGEKTYMSFSLTARNPGGHSSQPRDDNAIYDLAAAIMKLKAYRFPLKHNDTTVAFMKEMATRESGELGKALAAFASDPSDRKAADVIWKYPSYVGITRTTCIPTLLKGGHAENALPQSAVGTVNCRVFPGETVAEVKGRIEKAIDNGTIEVTVLDKPAPSPVSPLRDDVMGMITASLHTQYPGVKITPYMAPYATDGKWSRLAGIPTYGVSGLFLGPDDDRSHGLDERVPVQSFIKSNAYWYDLLKRVGG